MTDIRPDAGAAPAVYVLHDNPDWIPPLREAFDELGVPLVEWVLEEGSVDLAGEPPQGVFWSRLSASSHTRDRAHAKDYARAVLRWLESHGRRTVNGSSVVEIEVSKVVQYSLLRAAGFTVPHTVAVFGRADLKRRARELPVPFITKHNQGGKGLGVRRFDSYDAFDRYVDSAEFEEASDGITLLQEFVESADQSITRAEFAGGAFVYAVRVDTSAGSFELCPADACQVDFSAQAVCAVPGSESTQDAQAAAAAGTAAFRERLDIDATDPLIRRLEAFLAAHRIEIAGVEFIEKADGTRVVYDVNTNTNYNSDVEALTNRSPRLALARFLGAELAKAAPALV
ncbi:RimK family alpha-L-glutamate ligase [Microbacterium sp. Marseille-Q6965]|uniref:ATP-grasp domain-containing protein n=1 Tax=Microbacterium sp. Marseille-Q6965 TaxID=2965072 RepID=UPI0021B802EB|nr:alpha-L-glutamate ligase [Microbacterium sp. Marseille-Q6965]